MVTNREIAKMKAEIEKLRANQRKNDEAKKLRMELKKLKINPKTQTFKRSVMKNARMAGNVTNSFLNRLARAKI